MVAGSSNIATGFFPLVSLQDILEPGSAHPEAGESVQVVVFGADDRCVGIVVDQIIDIVEETVGMRRRSKPRRGLLGSGVVGKRVADFVDLEGILKAAEEELLNEAALPPATLLLADSSAFNRGLMRNHLEMAGYRVIEAATSAEMLQQMEAEVFQLVLAGVDLLAGDPPALDRFKRSSGADNLRLIGLVNSPREIEERRALYPEFDDYQVRFESEAMLRSVDALGSVAESAAPGPAGRGGTRFIMAGTTKNSADLNDVQLATFVVGRFLFGIDVLNVQEVLRFQRMTRVPLAPPVIVGLINLRGQIVPAIDMRRRLFLEPGRPANSP